MICTFAKVLQEPKKFNGNNETVGLSIYPRLILG